MSFSYDTKLEIINNEITKNCCASAELLGIICFGGHLRRDDNGYFFKITTEKAKIARRAYNLIKYVFDISASIEVYKKTVKTSTYTVRIDSSVDVIRILRHFNFIGENETAENFLNYKISPRFVDRPCCKKSFIKGAFLMSGSINNPEKNYHLEFVTHRYNISVGFKELLYDMGFEAKSIVRKSNYVLYFKNSEAICDVLTVMGAVNALWTIENIKITKEINNNLNRVYNFEDANLNKTIDASSKQRESINKLKESGKLDELSPLLREIALLRLENSECSLKELGEMLTPPISKSGVNHRLRKLMEFADKL